MLSFSPGLILQTFLGVWNVMKIGFWVRIDNSPNFGDLFAIRRRSSSSPTITASFVNHFWRGFFLYARNPWGNKSLNLIWQKWWRTEGGGGLRRRCELPGVGGCSGNRSGKLPWGFWSRGWSEHNHVLGFNYGGRDRAVGGDDSGGGYRSFRARFRRIGKRSG